MSTQSLTLDVLRDAVATGAAFRSRAVLQPAGGVGDKVFPPTYSGAVYAVEQRRIPGREDPVTCVLLDSVQSQANRMEEALQDAADQKRLSIPVITVDFSKAEGLLDPIDRVTSLQAPHRAVDAILRDSLLGDRPFRQSDPGKRLDQVSARNATALFELCPTALLFGMWDSTGPKGGLGAKFARAMVSEIVGIDAAFGTKTSSRIDPLQIQLKAGPLYRASSDGGIAWTLDPDQAIKEKGKPAALGKDGRPSEANHGNVTPSGYSKYTKGAEGPDPMQGLRVEARQGGIAPGGVTIAYAEQLTVLSLPALRRLCFPQAGKPWTPCPEQQRRDEASRVVLAALGLCAAALAAEKGLDLRSRCLLWPDHELTWELLGKPGTKAVGYEVSAEHALKLLKEAVAAAGAVGLSWRQEPLVLEPSPQLVALVRKSQVLAVAGGEEDGGEG